MWLTPRISSWPLELTDLFHACPDSLCWQPQGDSILQGLKRGRDIPLPQLFDGREERCGRDKQIQAVQVCRTRNHSLISFNFQLSLSQQPCGSPCIYLMKLVLSSCPRKGQRLLSSQPSLLRSHMNEHLPGVFKQGKGRKEAKAFREHWSSVAWQAATSVPFIYLIL